MHFHISLISRYWYNNSKYNTYQKNLNIPTYQFTGKESKLPSLQPLTFQYLVEFKQSQTVKQLQGPKQKYGFGMGYAKKALDLAI